MVNRISKVVFFSLFSFKQKKKKQIKTVGGGGEMQLSTNSGTMPEK